MLSNWNFNNNIKLAAFRMSLKVIIKIILRRLLKTFQNVKKIVLKVNFSLPIRKHLNWKPFNHFLNSNSTTGQLKGNENVLLYTEWRKLFFGRKLDWHWSESSNFMEYFLWIQDRSIKLYEKVIDSNKHVMYSI